MDEIKKLRHDEIEEILAKIEAHAARIKFSRGFNIGLLHSVNNSRIYFVQSYIESLKEQELTAEQEERLKELERKLYIPS
jgi:hypothetical protein